MTRVRNSDRQKALFIPPFRRKFREASSDETGTESFYGGNFCEISDDHAPLTVFEVHFMNASYRISLLYCCILMVTSALSLLKEVTEVIDRRNRCGSSSIPVVLISTVNAHREEHRTRKVRSEIRLILFGEALRSVSDCLMHSAEAKPSRTRRDRRNWYWLLVRPSGLTSDTQDDYIIFHYELSRTSPVTVMIYRWIIERAVVPSRGNTNSRARIGNSMHLNHSGNLSIYE